MHNQAKQIKESVKIGNFDVQEIDNLAENIVKENKEIAKKKLFIEALSYLEQFYIFRILCKKASVKNRQSKEL